MYKLFEKKKEMTDKKKKFDINTIDIETSSQGSKFNVDDYRADSIENDRMNGG